MKNLKFPCYLSRVLILILATAGVIPTLAADVSPRERLLFNETTATVADKPGASGPLSLRVSGEGMESAEVMVTAK